MSFATIAIGIAIGLKAAIAMPTGKKIIIAKGAKAINSVVLRDDSP